MKGIIIDETFKNKFLICGETWDNFVFQDCLKEFVDEAFLLLSERKNECLPCNIKITEIEEAWLELTLNTCENNMQRQLFARDYFCCLYYKSVLQYIAGSEEEINKLNNCIKALLSGNFDKARAVHASCPMPHECTKLSKELKEMELNIFLINAKNVFLQQAINNFISSREPYSIKLFTTRNNLSTYYNQIGQLIECPHDYMTLNVNKYVSAISEK